METEPNQPMDEIIRKDGRYSPEAFSFLHEGLSRTVELVYGEGSRPVGESHVSGQDLCRGLATLARERWGLLAKTVLTRWNIRESIDFGNMVYLLIDAGFMHKNDEDSIEDFRDVFTFDEAFDKGGEFELKQ